MPPPRSRSGRLRMTNSAPLLGMKGLVVCLRHNHEVLDSIVSPVSVDVVNLLVCTESPSKMVLHNRAVFEDVVPVLTIEAYVAGHPERAAPLPEGRRCPRALSLGDCVARRRAMLRLTKCYNGRRPRELVATRQAATQDGAAPPAAVYLTNLALRRARLGAELPPVTLDRAQFPEKHCAARLAGTLYRHHILRRCGVTAPDVHASRGYFVAGILPCRKDS